jgi:hypothetical protein
MRVSPRVTVWLRTTPFTDSATACVPVAVGRSLWPQAPVGLARVVRPNVDAVSLGVAMGTRGRVFPTSNR